MRLSELLNICSSGFWEPSMAEAENIYQTKHGEDPYQHIYHIDWILEINICFQDLPLWFLGAISGKTQINKLGPDDPFNTKYPFD